jgi:sulfite exporter TauE/SafE
MNTLQLFPIFLAGLAGGVHCIGMCGGIVSAFSAATRPAFPVPVTTVSTFDAQAGRGLRMLAYHAGRIGSYMTAGAIAGGLIGGVQSLAQLGWLQLAAMWLANLMLIALGLYLMRAWLGLAWLEAQGQLLWRHLQPLTRRLLPLDRPDKAFALGMLWGWLPCGMVYSMLTMAMLAGSAIRGAEVMLAFGLGTLPALLGVGLAQAGLAGRVNTPGMQKAAGLIVLAFGLFGIARAVYGVPAGWADVFCITPGAAR